jgi:predicted glutamine amidotransferase
MCIAILQKLNSPQIKEQEFQKYGSDNPHGFGIMYNHNEKLVIQKTLDLKYFWELYNQIYQKYSKTSLIGIHFRFSTGGKKDIENCHPFNVNENIGMMHNGVLSSINSDENHSDTYNFNEQYCKPLGNDIFDYEGTLTLLKDLIVYSNKMIFFNNKNKYLIINEDNGRWKNDIWYSFYSSNNIYSSTNFEKNNYQPSTHNAKHSYQCKICEEFMSDIYLYTISNPFGFKTFICYNCLNENTKISDVLKILNPRIVSNRNIIS